ncbi:MAG: HEAT repeat domain-containing protein [Nostocaceae cyanobacterium]|nr:HEAT repeat domain-containing protein [Nostocaceae cyanobacterium]
MRLCRSSILILSCLTCLVFEPSAASSLTRVLSPQILKLAQNSSTEITRLDVLRLGSRGKKVEVLQTQLQDLGYYDGEIDGKYGETTRNAVLKFQEEQSLKADGVAGSQTQKLLQTELDKKRSLIATSTLEATPQPQKSSGRSFVWWLLLGMGILGTIGAVLYLRKLFGKSSRVPNPSMLEAETSEEVEANNRTTPHSQPLNSTGDEYPHNSATNPQLLPAQQTSRLAKVNIIDELIGDLHSHDSTKRRKAIWDLGQMGDSRAIQPLVDLMIDADSQQRSLILAALAEIGSRTLKPMNRALAISLQDESPQVRQNAIRDLTRIYDMMTQISQMLCHAAQDADADVQATAKYALAQMNRIRTLPELESVQTDSQSDVQKSIESHQDIS